MQTSGELSFAAPPHRHMPGAGAAGSVLRFMRRKPLGAIGLVLMVVFVVLALLAPIIAPHEPNVGIQDATYHAPSGAFPLGTDKFGRDELSRVVTGARISLQVGVLTVALGVGFGVLVGLVSGYFGGATDFVTQRVVESFQSLPNIVFALAIVTALGRSLWNVVLALAIASWPGASRVIRSNVLSIKTMSYIDAARATGCGSVRFLLRHVLPNVIPVAIILATAGLGGAILAEASLSFLGVGIRPPTPSWGSMINDSVGVMQRYPYLLIFPGIAISLVVFAFNFLGDALRDYLDPRLRGSR
jgi:peptide/nickel transport system permease protein